MRVSSFEVFEMVAQEADVSFSPVYKRSAYACDIMKRCLDTIDNLIEEKQGDGFDVHIDETDMSVCVSALFGGDNEIRIVFTGVWEKIE